MQGPENNTIMHGAMEQPDHDKNATTRTTHLFTSNKHKFCVKNRGTKKEKHSSPLKKKNRGVTKKETRATQKKKKKR